MRATFIFIFSLYGTLAAAQDMPESRLISTNFSSGSAHTEQAVQTLSATNKLAPESQVDYKAGRSVVLLPGFEVKPGAVFTAHIGKVSVVATIEGQVEPLAITAYPNPFTETTTIAYTLSHTARVTLFISDAQGAVLGHLVDNQTQEAGRHTVEWRGGTLAAGVYICTLDANQQRVSNRLIRK